MNLYKLTIFNNVYSSTCDIVSMYQSVCQGSGFAAHTAKHILFILIKFRQMPKQMTNSIPFSILSEMLPVLIAFFPGFFFPIMFPVVSP